MDVAYLSALSALAGSAIGALTSFLTTWLVQNSQYRSVHLTQARTRRETLYGDFIDEASRLFADAIGHNLKDLDNLVHIYGIVGRLRLFASAGVVKEAEAVMEAILTMYDGPNLDLHAARAFAKAGAADPLKAFSVRCREEPAASA